MDKFPDCKTQKFTDRYNMDRIEDVFHFSDALIAEICETSEEAELLVKELIAELQISKSKEKKIVH